MTCPFSNPRGLFQDLATSRGYPGFEYSESLGGHVISRYEDIISVLDRPDVFSSRPTVPDFPPPVKPIFAGKVPEKGTLLAWDNPDHDRLRRSVAGFFVPRKLQRFEPLLRATAHDLVDDFVANGRVEIKNNFALPLPLRTIVAVAGLDPARWKWIGQCLSLFGGITNADNDVPIQQKVKDVVDLHDYVASVIEERRKDRRDDLISHIWNERDAGNVEMTDFEHLGMIPGLLLAGHETTTNVLSMGLSHLLAKNLWKKATESDESRGAAIEELLRYESAITGMRRKVTKKTTVGSTIFHPGEMLFVAYNSGSRDITKFDNPDELDLGRRSKTQHLGFGRGIHACLGAPFARLLLRTELAVLQERLPNLSLLTPYDEVQYLHVHEGRGPVAVEIAWDPLPVERMLNRPKVSVAGSTVKIPLHRQDQEMNIAATEMATSDIMLLTLQPSNGNSLPKWTPGAHIDLAVGNLGHRQYSLCSDPSVRSTFQVAVLKEENGTGGSKHIHDTTVQGGKILIKGPRNNFAFKPGDRKTIFVAGGIGITPMKPMAALAAARGLDYQLVYLGKTRADMAFVEELAKTHGNRLNVWAADEHGGQRFDLASFFAAEDTSGLKVYSCGPEALLGGLEAVLSSAPPDTLRVERLANAAVAVDAKNESFEVVLGRSGKSLTVPKDRTLLDVINDAGAGMMSTCNKGLCGTCEVRVLEGVPEHRDAVLTPAERAEGTSIMACVSRCKGKRLVLDLW
ncbi:cytochrome P450 [Plectosphaerella plurivora]|uniref:Cytochrome P450 n=1 Tax=Plectosphaerella plurivora TaxID=936078 RepID=A0A9P8V0I3_9PEZI|nr:cytochrome P450 [Plectosphaerella plurivora]